jgi:hypothetical protein
VLVNQPSLGDQLATLRASAEAILAPAWLPEALHALILACLLRLFGRLESMISHWQAGLLPPPPQPRPASPARHAAPRPAPPRLSLLARLAAFLSGETPCPHATRMPTPGASSRARPSTRMDRARRAQHAGKTECACEHANALCSTPAEQNAPAPPPSHVLALPCFSVPLCLCGPLLPSRPAHPTLIRRAARAPPPKQKFGQNRQAPTHALNVPVS